MTTNWKNRTLTCLLAAIAFAPSWAQSSGETSAFGSAVRSESALIGIFYDLKQTQKHKPTKMTPSHYLEVFAQFLDADWDEAILNQYYRATKPLYTTEVFIPTISADIAPKAYGVEKMVQPRLWMVHYKGQVSPPEDGTYRFLGSADDVLAVAVNSKTVLVAMHPNLLFRGKWYSRERGDVRKGYTVGDWFEAKKDKPIDIDIIIGECPGQVFNSNVIIQKKDTVYSMDSGKVPKIPPFQLSANALTAKYPEAKIWKGWQ